MKEQSNGTRRPVQRFCQQKHQCKHACTVTGNKGVAACTCKVVAGAEGRRDAPNRDARVWRQLSPGRGVVGALRVHLHVRGREQAVEIRAGRRTVRAGRQDEIDARAVVVDARTRGCAPACVRLAPVTRHQKRLLNLAVSSLVRQIALSRNYMLPCTWQNWSTAAPIKHGSLQITPPTEGQPSELQLNC